MKSCFIGADASAWAWTGAGDSDGLLDTGERLATGQLRSVAEAHVPPEPHAPGLRGSLEVAHGGHILDSGPEPESVTCWELEPSSSACPGPRTHCRAVRRKCRCATCIRSM